MPPIQTTTEELQAAWNICLKDREHRVFTRNSYDEILVSADTDTFFTRLQSNLADGTYTPSDSQICMAPKGKGHVRPGSMLCFTDHLVFTLLLMRNLPVIRAAVAQIDRVSFDNKIATDERPLDWFTNPIGGWMNFRISSTQKIDSGVPVVVIADITACYENIDLSTLFSDLNSINFDPQDLVLLSSCLNRWATAKKGLPQGYGASDILAKLYLQQIDRQLVIAGIDHHRYVDDYRIYELSENKAKRSIMLLANCLRQRGLCLHSSKTKILRSSQARQQIDGIVPTINAIRSQLTISAQEHLGMHDSVTDSQIFQYLEQLNGDDAPEVLRTTFDAYFSQDTDSSFDKSLLRYLLNRLGVAKDKHAIAQIPLLLKRHPQETECLLRYTGKVDPDADQMTAICGVIFDHENPYYHQLYQTWSWAVATGGQWVIGEMLNNAIRHATNVQLPSYVRHASWKIIATSNNQVAISSIAQQYSDLPDHYDQLNIMMSLRNMEQHARNDFLGRRQNDSVLHQIAARYAKGQLAN